MLSEINLTNKLSKTSVESAIDVLVCAMELAETLKIPGKEKAKIVHKSIDKIIEKHENDKAVEYVSDQIVAQLKTMKDVSLFQPVIDALVLASKHLIDLNVPKMKNKCLSFFGI